MAKAITFCKENECKKQDGISPESIIYCGRIEDVKDEHLIEAGWGYNEFFNSLADAKENEDCVLIVRGNF